jgi:cobalt-precorrin 5A hydrolase
MKKLAVIAITKGGAELARRLRDSMHGEAELYLPVRFMASGDGALALGDDLASGVGRMFGMYRGLVFIMATGIVVRMVAPHVNDKLTDPAVVVVDESGRHAISLLSGHAGGANELTGKVAKLIGATPVITTASDVQGRLAVDTLAELFGCLVEDREAAKKVSAAIVNGEAVSVYSHPGIELIAKLPKIPGNFRLYTNFDDLLWSERAASIVITPLLLDEYADALGTAAVLRPRTLVVGIGCNRGTSGRDIECFFDETLARAGLSPLSVRNLATITDKDDEEGLIAFAKRRGLDIDFIQKDMLVAAGTPSGPSGAVYRNMGVYGVSEPAALVSAGATKLIVRKMKSKDVTIAVAEAAV